MTHRVFSRSASSSRAIPIERVIQNLLDGQHAEPVYWGANKSGMQAETEITSIDDAKAWWRESLHTAVMQARRGIELGLHKQIVNRVLEPFCPITTIITATELENFYTLRTDKAAQPEFQRLATMMLELDTATPAYEVDWSSDVSWIEKAHLPFVTATDAEALSGITMIPTMLPFGDLVTQQLCFIAAARCARVSYLRQLEQRTVQEDLDLASRLYAQKHMSPFEHVAFASFVDCQSGNFHGFVQLRQMLGTPRA
jgi:hypothetical protein